jgi:hypothetical protein
VLEVLTVSRDDFAVSAHCDGPTIKASLRGTADHTANELVQVLLDRIHADARVLDVSSVEVDIRGLEFLSSSCFRHFIDWLARVHDLDDRHRYSVQFLSSPQFHWQRRTLESLRCFGDGLVEILSAAHQG